jgi:hypothetical protein
MEITSRQPKAISKNASARLESANYQKRLAETNSSRANRENYPATFNNSAATIPNLRHRDRARREQFTREERDALAERALREDDF